MKVVWEIKSCQFSKYDDDEDESAKLLNKGWEPFSITIGDFDDEAHDTLWLKRIKPHKELKSK